MKTLVCSIFVYLALVIAEANETTSQPTNDAEQTSSGFTLETKAALWAGFCGGLIAVFGIGMLFYQLKLRKYEEYKHREGDISILPPVGEPSIPGSLGCCGR